MGVYASERIFKFDTHSIAIVRGVAKIALEFALENRVELRFLSKIRDALLNFAESDPIQKLVTQYYPTTDEEKIYEVSKHKHEDWYPNHQLTLFSDGSDLYCYVEIFGAIQKYVHLSREYGGPKILKRFTQRVKSWVFNPSDWTGSAKDLHLSAGHLGVQFEGRPLKDIEKDVLHLARIRSYTLDPDIQVSKVEAIMQALIHYVVVDIKGVPSVDELLEKTNSADQTFGLSMLNELKANPLAAIRMIQKSYWNFRAQAGKGSCPNLRRDQPFNLCLGRRIFRSAPIVLTPVPWTWPTPPGRKYDRQQLYLKLSCQQYDQDGR